MVWCPVLPPEAVKLCHVLMQLAVFVMFPWLEGRLIRHSPSILAYGSSRGSAGITANDQVEIKARNISLLCLSNHAAMNSLITAVGLHIKGTQCWKTASVSTNQIGTDIRAFFVEAV